MTCFFASNSLFSRRDGDGGLETASPLVAAVQLDVATTPPSSRGGRFVETPLSDRNCIGVANGCSDGAAGSQLLLSA